MLCMEPDCQWYGTEHAAAHSWRWGSDSDRSGRDRAWGKSAKPAKSDAKRNKPVTERNKGPVSNAERQEKWYRAHKSERAAYMREYRKRKALAK